MHEHEHMRRPKVESLVNLCVRFLAEVTSRGFFRVLLLSLLQPARQLRHAIYLRNPDLFASHT